MDWALSRKLAADIHQIARRARNEEELKIQVEAALKPVLAKLRVGDLGQHSSMRHVKLNQKYKR